MVEKNNQIVKKFGFNFLNDSKKLKIWRVSFLIFFIVIFLIMFFISLTNNGYRFLFDDKDSIINYTLLKTLIAILCGFGLTTAGCAMQGVTRNDIAGPTTMGFMPAATLGIMLYQITQKPSIPLMICFALIFSFLILLMNFFTLKIQKNNTKGYKMILTGVITGALITSVSSILTSLIPIINETVVPWIGTVTTNISWDNFVYCGPLILIGILLISIMSKNLNIIENDPALAKSLGLNAEKTFWVVGLGTVLITVSSVIMIGSITMIGIVIPHLVRMIFRTRNYKFIIPFSGVISSFIMLLSLWINSVYTLGLNLFAVAVSLPLFIYLVLFKKENR